MITDDRDPALALRLVRDVLHGATPIASPEAARTILKLLRLLMSDGDHDAWFDASGFFIRWAMHRRPTSYLPDGVASAVHALLRLGDPGGRCAPLRLHVDADATATATKGLWKVARWVWIRDDDDAVRIFVRDVKSEEAQPETPPPLPEWRSPSRVFAELPNPMACRHCGVAHARFRAIANTFVCAACGGSFAVEPTVLASATLRED